MTSLDCTIDGEFFVSGSGDKLLKLMHYDDGIPIGIGNNTPSEARYATSIYHGEVPSFASSLTLLTYSN